MPLVTGILLRKEAQNENRIHPHQLCRSEYRPERERMMEFVREGDAVIV